MHDASLKSGLPFPRLSKSKFLAGLQCHKRVYLEAHQPYLATPPDPATRAILDMGTEIGTLARQRFPGGVLVAEGFRQREGALARTAALLRDPDVPAIFEGAFEHDGVFVRVDILERVPAANGTGSAWRLIEVKSSTRVKDIHVDDLAVQSLVLLGAGLTLAGAWLMHIDTSYCFQGDGVDLRELFALEDLSERVATRKATVSGQLAVMKDVLVQPEAPAVEPDAHCHTPHECPFWAHCTHGKPERWIYHLPGSRHTIDGLARQGIETIDDIPETATLSIVQRRMKENVEWVSDKLHHTLRSVTYPVHHLDFETVMLPVPRYRSTRPYQSIPVQWSNHVELAPGRLLHQEFIHDEATEPRKRWAEALLESVGTRGTICVYSLYEEAIIKQLVEAFPEFRSAFRPILKRLWDLHAIIKDHYYHPAFLGSYSIKTVLPAVVPSLGYEDLTIKDGGQAAREYYRMVFSENDWVERAAIREALLRYCARDTFAMAEVRRVLGEKAGAEGRR